MLNIFSRAKQTFESESELKTIHDPFAIQVRLDKPSEVSYIRDFVFAAMDGSVTTFAVVATVFGAKLHPGIVVVMGLANLVGDGFSMAVGNFLGTRSQVQQVERARRREEYHIENCPEGERDEIRAIYRKKGFDGDHLEHITNTICADKERWRDEMVVEEYGLSIENPNPLKAALVTFSAFCIVGLIPLLAYIYEVAVPESARIHEPFYVAAALTGVCFIGIGVAKAPFVGQHWFLACCETFFSRYFRSISCVACRLSPRKNYSHCRSHVFAQTDSHPVSAFDACPSAPGGCAVSPSPAACAIHRFGEVFCVIESHVNLLHPW